MHRVHRVRRVHRGHRAGACLLAIAVCLACAPHEAPAEVASISRQRIDHVTPRRDFVGPAPTRLEWTAVDGADSYDVTVVTEIDSRVFERRGARGTSIPWPKEITLTPGTYFWRVVGVKDGRSVADSGRSAFVVTD